MNNISALVNGDNKIKRIIVIAAIILIILIIFFLLLRSRTVNNTLTVNSGSQINGPSITPFGQRRNTGNDSSDNSSTSKNRNNETSTGQTNNSNDLSGSTSNTPTYNTLVKQIKERIRTFKPFENEDFKVQYSKILDKLVVTKKTLQAETAMQTWAQSNQLAGYTVDPQVFLIVNPNQKNISDSTIVQKLDYLKTSPVETTNFDIEYDNSVDIFAVEEKTELARDSFTGWAEENDILAAANNPNIFAYKQPEINLTVTPEPIKKQLNDPIFSNFLNIFFAIPKPLPTSSITPTTPNQNISSVPNNPLSPSPSGSPQISSPVNPSVLGEYTYYSQCSGSYDNVALPGGCTVCKAGCGLVTTSMIMSSFAGQQYNPQYVVNYYKSKGYQANCSGSTAGDAMSTMKAHGIKLTSSIIRIDGKTLTGSSNYRIMKDYLNSGWTFFTWATFFTSSGSCVNGCGHFLWITDFDDQGNIWAYDPYYGRSKTPPINLNSYNVTIRGTVGVKPAN